MKFDHDAPHDDLGVTVPILVVKTIRTQRNFIFQKQKYVQVSTKVPANGF